MTTQLPEPYEALAGALRSAADRLDAAEAAATAAPSRRRRLARWARGHVPLVVVGAVALSGTAAATVSVLSGEPSEPMRGRIAAVPSLGPQRYEVTMRPGAAVGVPTWCISTVVRGRRADQRMSATGCLPVRDRSRPLLGGGLTGGDEHGDGALFTQITTSEVAAIELPSGKRVLTRRDAALPDDLRIAITIFDRHEYWRMRHPKTPSPAGRSIATPLDADGKELSARAPEMFNPNVAIRTLPGALDAPEAQCGFSRAGGEHGLPKLRLVVPKRPVRAAPGLPGHPLLACAQLTIGRTDTVFPLTATIYVDAAAPGSARPADWPGAVERAGRLWAMGSDQMVPEPGAQLVERRGNAWLAIDGASPAQAIRLSQQLRIRVNLP